MRFYEYIMGDSQANPEGDAAPNCRACTELDVAEFKKKKKCCKKYKKKKHCKSCPRL